MLLVKCKFVMMILFLGKLICCLICYFWLFRCKFSINLVLMFKCRNLFLFWLNIVRFKLLKLSLKLAIVKGWLLCCKLLLKLFYKWVIKMVLLFCKLMLLDFNLGKIYLKAIVKRFVWLVKLFFNCFLCY